jgi:TIR domain/CobQ/CobB/MinD/ParA nucleotide binding domain
MIRRAKKMPERRSAARKASSKVTPSTARNAGSNAKRNGRIFTFYSYKGGTGRTMALANIGWILASAGKRVLLIDWDFEAPGLHRYLHPFLNDPELVSTLGLIDYFADFNVAARAAALKSADEVQSSGSMSASTAPTPVGDPWWSSWCTIARYTVSLDYKFTNDGVLDFVPAGNQCSSYAVRVNSLNWQEFYDKLGGGVLLEALKEQLRADYDYVLIDSRTGISDTAGICTVQMPDELVVFFTLNTQSIKGAAAVAGSAWAQRVKSDGTPGLQVWPVPTRVELAEKDRLDAARATAHWTFHRFVQLSSEERRRYWETVEVLYHPYYAYEEVLAPFAEATRSSVSLLRPMETLTSYITHGTAVSLKPMPESERVRWLTKFVNLTPAPTAAPSRRRRTVYVSYSARDQKDVHRLIADLNKQRIDTWSDLNLLLGDQWEETMSKALEAASVLLFVVPESTKNAYQEKELAAALRGEKRIVPVLIDRPFSQLPDQLVKRQAIRIGKKNWSRDVLLLSQQLTRILNVATEQVPIDTEDPQKGQWGGEKTRNGRVLGAAAKVLGEGWYEVKLTVKALPSNPPLEGTVRFHLHPSFPQAEIVTAVTNGEASISVPTWGAFTVGAVADGGETTLELDLAEEKNLPKAFREN